MDTATDTTTTTPSDSLHDTIAIEHDDKERTKEKGNDSLSEKNNEIIGIDVEAGMVKEDGSVKEEQEEIYPNGGWRAWGVVLAGALVQFTNFGYINAFGVYQDFYVRHYLTNYTPSDIGWIGGVQIFFNFSLGSISGRIFDRGYCRHLMIGSTIIYAVSLFMLSLSHQNAYYQVFLTNGAGLGIASGMSYTLTFAILGHYFTTKRALAVGIVSAGSAIGAIIHPIMLNRLINAPSIGFHTAVRISAAMNVVLLSIGAVLMKPRLKGKKVDVHYWRWITEKGGVYGWLCFGAIFCFTGLFFSVFYLQLDAILHNVDPKLAFYCLSILNASSFFGRILPTTLAPRIGVFNLGAGFTFLTGVVVFFMIMVKNLTGVILFAIFFGITSGACISMTTAMMAQTANHPSEVGTRMGGYFGIGGFFGLFASPISGALLTSNYLWTRSIAFAAANLAFCGLCFWVARCLVAKRRGSWRV